ncbi:MAG: hypothetical protein H7210_09940 [Pyrinomonadaceae bacterium]|nr:hypothetical protein [Phycisphaerales bacterium]
MILPLAGIESPSFALSIAGSATAGQGTCSGTVKAAHLPSAQMKNSEADLAGLSQLGGIDERSDAVIQRGIRRIAERASTRRSDSLEIRGDLVARVRAQIAAGEYDSPAKIEEAASRLVGHVDLLV